MNARATSTETGTRHANRELPPTPPAPNPAAPAEFMHPTRSVARAKPKRGEERALRFRPLAGRRYYLFLFFNGAYEQGRRESFTATMRSETVVRTPPPPPPRQR